MSKLREYIEYSRKYYNDQHIDALTEIASSCRVKGRELDLGRHRPHRTRLVREATAPSRDKVEPDLPARAGKPPYFARRRARSWIQHGYEACETVD